ncbi:hypothetical protein CO675_25735 [Bradyrhizobium sp. C9]|nr:hypothetical protein CO675_25735 [Bradyrhizobium sp. C9]
MIRVILAACNGACSRHAVGVQVASAGALAISTAPGTRALRFETSDARRQFPLLEPCMQSAADEKH